MFAKLIYRVLQNTLCTGLHVRFIYFFTQHVYLRDLPQPPGEVEIIFPYID